MTEEVQLPVESAIYGFRQACEQARRSMQEEVVRPATDWVRREEHRCREQECNWWCLCCNKWLCWIAIVVIKIITWVVTIVVKWVVTIVCQVVAFIVDIVLKLVIRILKFLVSFFVCLFSDPEGFGLLWGDMWSDMLSIGDEIIDFVTTLADDIVGILGDLSVFLLDLGESFGPVGVALFGVVAGLLDTVGKVIGSASETLQAVDDVVVGLMSGNLCRASAGLTNWVTGIARGVHVGLGAFANTLGGGKRGFDWLQTRATVEASLRTAFADDPVRLRRNLERCRLSAFPAGLPLTIDARRMVIRSGAFLRDLHERQVIDLYEIAGHVSECKPGWATSDHRKAGEVVYRGTDTRVSYSDLNAFLRDGPEAAPAFDVYPMMLRDFRAYLEWARDRGHQIGVDLRYDTIGEVEATEMRDIDIPANTAAPPLFHDLFDRFGRTGTASDNLGVIPAIAVFWISNSTRSFNGFTAWYRPPEAYEGIPDDERPPCVPTIPMKSGVAFIGRTPEWVFRSALIHELGHYLGLCHEGHDGAEHIMFTNTAGLTTITPNTVVQYGLMAADPYFTAVDTRDVWRWITIVAKDSLLP